MGNSFTFNKKMIFFLPLITIIYLLLSSVLAVEINPIEGPSKIRIASWIIGYSCAFIGIFTFYYLIKASRVYKGKIGSNLLKIFMFIMFMFIITLILALITTLSQFMDVDKIPDYIYLIVAIAGLIPIILLFNGSRSMYNLTRI